MTLKPVLKSTTMKSITLIFICLLTCSTLSGTQLTDSILKVLDREIDNREFYYQKKEDRLNTLKAQLNHIQDTEIKFNLCNQLFNEYITYQYDSAYTYASRSKILALEMDHHVMNTIADYNLFYCYVSTGLFKEAYDMMGSINIQDAPNKVKADYYELCMRLFSDMSSYNEGTPFNLEYNHKISLYCDSALLFTPPHTFEYARIQAFNTQNSMDNARKIKAYEHLLSDYETGLHEKAVIYSILGRIYCVNFGDMDNAIYYMALAAIQDIKSATRETTAKKELASYLYGQGQVMKASRYIQMALEEVTAYNARHRKMEINSILPIVEKQRLSIIEKQKRELTIYLITLSILLIALLGAIVTIYKQIKKLRLAKQSIQQQYNKISVINEELEESNEIKDQYIIQSLYGKSDYLDKVESLLKKQERRIKARQYDDLQSIYKEFNIKSERETVSSSFDEAFLKLFPNFIEEYNKLFNPADRVTLDANNNLTPELRIFALIRLGVSENERIASFLNLSVNTIYVYKAKVKGKTIIPKEEFEYRIMRIKKQSHGNP